MGFVQMGRIWIAQRKKANEWREATGSRHHGRNELQEICPDWSMHMCTPWEMGMKDLRTGQVNECFESFHV